jgi:hypothetical protein
MSEQPTNKATRPTPLAPMEVPTCIGTLRVLPLKLTLLVGILQSADGGSDEELGRRVVAEILRKDDRPLTDDEWQSLKPEDREAVVRAARLVPGDVTSPPLAALGSSVRQSGKSLVKPIVQAADRFSQALATLPKNVVDQINLHSAALDKASESLRTSAAAFIKSDLESQERFNAILKGSADLPEKGIRSRREGEFSLPEPPLIARQPALDHLREQTDLARKGVQATTETAQRTAVMVAHMATVASEMSALSNLLMTELLPSWRQSDLDNRRSANRSLRLGLGALVVTVVLTGLQIWWSRIDRAEDLKRLAADAAQAEQRERAAEARQQRAERDAAALRELLQQSLRERQGTASAAPVRPAVQGRGSPKRTP